MIINKQHSLCYFRVELKMYCKSMFLKAQLAAIEEGSTPIHASFSHCPKVDGLLSNLEQFH